MLAGRCDREEDQGAETMRGKNWGVRVPVNC